MSDSALIIFIKNPIFGKVKTRLAATIGHQKALEVYIELLKNIHSKTKKLNVSKLVFYSSKIDQNDIWESDIYLKKLQDTSPDLGQRMYAAFEEARHMGYKKCIIVGSDIYEIKTSILNLGFELLEKSNAVLGPTFDGGYYALGINFEKNIPNDFLKKLFLNKGWSHENVAQEALEIIEQFSLQCNFLPTLSDIDSEEDLKKFPGLYNIL